MNNKTYITNSKEETKSLGEQLAKKLESGDFLAFYGNLGSGKTTFIQGLAKGLGIKRIIISPTFIIIRTYKLQLKTPAFVKASAGKQKAKVKTATQNSKFFYHIDLYRTETKNDFLSVGLDEIIEDKNNIVALEWAEKMRDMLPDKRIELHFKYIDENKREVTIRYM